MDQRHGELRADLRANRGPAADRFLSDLRALRARSGLDQGGLAARAHYPRDVIAAAESVLPRLPVLAAYVRGCGGSGDDVVEWEDRWRSVTGTPASPLLSARVAGDSDAASAGARLSAASPAASADSQDPAVIMAALDRFGERLAQPDRAAGPGPGSPVGVDPGPPAAPVGSGAGAGVRSGTVTDAVQSRTGTSRTADTTAGNSSGDPASDSASDSAGPEHLGPLQRVPREEPRDPDGQRGGTSGRTHTLITVAVLICLVLILLAF